MTSTDRPRNLWSDLSLAGQFALAGGLIMLLAAIVIGFWVSRRIEDAVVRNTANATALYMESFIAPLSQDLARGQEISATNRAEIARLLTDTPLGSRVVSFKIWVKGPRVVASSDLAIVGKTFPATENVTQAWKGQVMATFNDLVDEEDRAEHALNMPLLEIYAPIRARASGQIIAVAEFYEIATQLRTDLTRARMTSWLAVFLILAAIGGALFAIVLRGSRIIDRQIVALGQMASHNVSLRLKVQGAAARFSQMNDQALRRIGADLHDGPAQLMGFAALRLDYLRSQAANPAVQTEIDAIEKAIREAIQDIRNISRGVSLPDIERRTLADVVQGLVDAHAARTQTEVGLTLDLPPDTDLPIAVKICAARVVQEGLTNAWRHAGGQGQGVSVHQHDHSLIVAVLDRGPGLPEAAPTPEDAEQLYGLGLAGLIGRVESLGGVLTLANRSDGRTGTELRMILDLRGVE
jgi:signal transduction histidine kinase